MPDGKDWNQVATVAWPDGTWGLRLLITVEVASAETYPLRVAVDVGARWTSFELADLRCHQLAAKLGWATSPFESNTPAQLRAIADRRGIQVDW